MTKKLSTRKALQLWKLIFNGLIEVYDSEVWPSIKQLIFVLLEGDPKKIQALRDGDLDALEKTTAPA